MGGELEVEKIACQYRQAIVRQAIWRRLHVPNLNKGFGIPHPEVAAVLWDARRDEAMAR